MTSALQPGTPPAETGSSRTTDRDTISNSQTLTRPGFDTRSDGADPAPSRGSAQVRLARTAALGRPRPSRASA